MADTEKKTEEEAPTKKKVASLLKSINLGGKMWIAGTPLVDIKKDGKTLLTDAVKKELVKKELID